MTTGDKTTRSTTLARADDGSPKRYATGGGLWTRWAAFLGPIGAAILYVGASTSPAWALGAWASPGLLLVSVRGRRPAHAFLWGVLFAFLVACGLAGSDLLTVSPYFDGNPLLPAGVVKVCFIVCAGLPYGLLTFAYARLGVGTPSVARSSLAAWMWVATELLRGGLPVPVRWAMLGYTQFENELLTEIIGIGGVYAVSFVVVLVSVAGAELIAELSARPLDLVGIGRRLAIPALAFVTVLLYGVSSERLHEATGRPYVTRDAVARRGDANHFQIIPQPVERRMPGIAI